MADSHSWHDDIAEHVKLKPLQQNNMSVLTMPAPSSNPAFRNDLPWDMAGPHNSSSCARLGSRNISLPSIRQTFPDLLLDSSMESIAANCPSAHEALASSLGPVTTSDNPSSPNEHKKRRISTEQDLRPQRASQVPRLHRSAEGLQPCRMSPNRGQLPTSSTNDGWLASGTNSHSTLLAAGHPTQLLDRNSRVEPLPDHSPKFDRDVLRMHQSRDLNLDQHSDFKSAAMSMTISASATENTTFARQGYKFPYHEPSQFQCVSTTTGSSHSTPFKAAQPCQPHHQDTTRYADNNATGFGSDVKQRKRRGNLPRETTNKLRAWFVAHLQHPYPTEDEKQALMRQTGLQMNQISNWFINARRRQLPTMINNARAESDAIHNHVSSSVESSAFASTEKIHEHMGRREDSLPFSDDEGRSYKDMVNDPQRAAWLDRESI